MRRRRLAGLLLLVAVLTLGCWSRVEINDLAIVGLVGIDLTEEGQVQLWINVIVPARAGGAPGTGMSPAQPGNPFITLRSEGETVLQAASRLQTQLPRRIFWAHARVILIGERLAKTGSRLAVDFLTRHRELRLTNYVLVVQGKVEEIMANPVDLERLPAEYIREIERTRVVPVSNLRDWVQDLAAKGADPMLAVAETAEPPPGAPPGQRTGVRVNRAALFRGDKLVEYVDPQLAQGILWLRGEIRVGVVTVEVPKVPGKISVEWLYSHVTRTVRLENGRVTVYVEVRTEGDVTEEQAKLDLSDPTQLRRVEAQLNRQIKAQIDAAVRRMQELNVDSARLGEDIHKQLPAVWKRLEKNWQEENFRKTRVVVSVDARIRRTGLTSQPQGVQEEELIKGR
ncbi:MAG TPA: Ger(x)C family spore germination protein [Symbiobacteriaceae bacterium]|nr:Ger(x)C family spore germination protein [Symbiobacteriaceae bacterium]